MAQMPWGWGNLLAEQEKVQGGLRGVEARMTLPGSQTMPSATRAGRVGVEPLRGIHRGYPRRAATTLLCWPSGLEDRLAQRLGSV